MQSVSKFLEVLSKGTINITTYRKAGEEVHTPVWIVNIDGYARSHVACQNH